MEARNRSLSEWFPRINTGQLRLPRFQRHESWGVAQVEGLIQTVVNQLPAGSVLTLEIAGIEPFVSRVLSGADDPARESANEHLLDGQQRLTALWRSLKDDYEDRSYFISTEEVEEENEGFTSISYPKYLKENGWYPLWMNDPMKVWERKLIPVSILRPDTDAEKESKKWAKDVAGGNADLQIELIEIINDLRNRFANFNIPFLSLPSNTDPAIALDVFIKLNTSGSPLTPFDIVVAQAEAHTGESLHDKLDELRSAIPELEKYVDPEQVILSVGALLSNRAPVRKSYLASDFPETLIDNFPIIQRGLQRAISFIEDERVFGAKLLPTEPSFYVLSAIWSHDNISLDNEGNLRSLSKKYFWSASLTDRYEKTASTRALSDYRQLMEAVKVSDNLSEVDIFNRSNFPLPTVEDLLSASWPARKDRLARAIVALSLSMSI